MGSDSASIPHVYSITEIAAALAETPSADETPWQVGFSIDGQSAIGRGQSAWARHRASTTFYGQDPFLVRPSRACNIQPDPPNTGLTNALRDTARRLDLDNLPLWHGTLLRLYVWRRFPGEDGITRWHVVCSCAPQLAGELLEPRLPPVPPGRLL